MNAAGFGSSVGTPGLHLHSSIFVIFFELICCIAIVFAVWHALASDEPFAFREMAAACALVPNRIVEIKIVNTVSSSMFFMMEVGGCVNDRLLSILPLPPRVHPSVGRHQYMLGGY